MCVKSGILDEILSKLGGEFKITANNPECFVGRDITQTDDKTDITINQHDYITRMLAQFGMSNVKPLSSPADVSSDQALKTRARFKALS
jgi:hypothetical protein